MKNYAFYFQVNISIWDVNDNAPEFDVGTVKISVPENTRLNEAIYAAHATDLDSGQNGIIHYRLLQNPDNMFIIDKVCLIFFALMSKYFKWFIRQ